MALFAKRFATLLWPCSKTTCHIRALVPRRFLHDSPFLRRFAKCWHSRQNVQFAMIDFEMYLMYDLLVKIYIQLKFNWNYAGEQENVLLDTNVWTQAKSTTVIAWESIIVDWPLNALWDVSIERWKVPIYFLLTHRRIKRAQNNIKNICASFPR